MSLENLTGESLYLIWSRVLRWNLLAPSKWSDFSEAEKAMWNMFADELWNETK